MYFAVCFTTSFFGKVFISSSEFILPLLKPMFYIVKADKLPDVFFLYRFEGISTSLPTPFSPTPVCPIYILRV